MTDTTEAGVDLLAKLSVELRNEIYRFYFSDNVLIPRDSSQSCKMPGYQKIHDRRLLQTSKMVLAEASPVENSMPFAMRLEFRDIPCLSIRGLAKKLGLNACDGRRGVSAEEQPDLRPIDVLQTLFGESFYVIDPSAGYDIFKHQADISFFRDSYFSPNRKFPYTQLSELLPRNFIILIDSHVFVELEMLDLGHEVNIVDTPGRRIDLGTELEHRTEHGKLRIVRRRTGKRIVNLNIHARRSTLVPNWGASDRNDSKWFSLDQPRLPSLGAIDGRVCSNALTRSE